MTQDPDFCKMEYKKDDKGQDVLLKDGKFQVMMEWEKPYMEACIDVLKPCGDVLEVGFGLGYSAERIQSYSPSSHTIIEYHPEVAKRAREWAKKYPCVTIVENTWQQALANLGLFDSIFFDDYPLESEDQLSQMEKNSAASQTLLYTGEKVLQEVEKQLPFLNTIQYSDEDLFQFMQQIPLNHEEEVVQVVRFLTELLSRHQISADQLDRQLQKLVADNRLTTESVAALLTKAPQKKPFVFSGANDRFYQFLSLCLQSHMKIGSRFSCFLSSPTSKFEDPKFFNEIILNPLLDFHEEEILLEVPSTCAYFSGGKALVVTITKQG